MGVFNLLPAKSSHGSKALFTHSLCVQIFHLMSRMDFIAVTSNSVYTCLHVQELDGKDQIKTQALAQTLRVSEPRINDYQTGR